MASFKYKNVADQIRELIFDGTYAVGKRIPTEPELSEKFGVGRQTLRKAVALLEEDGFLRRVQGSGTYVCEWEKDALEKEAAEASKLQREHNRSIALVMMNNKNYIFIDVMNGISSYLTEKGYALNIYITDGCYETERKVLEQLLEDRPAGILLEPVRSGICSANHALFKRIAQTIPCILLHADSPEIFPKVCLNDNLGAKRLTEYLISMGHEKIGTIFSFDECTGQNRYAGALEAMMEHGIRQEQDLALWTPYDKMADFFEGEARAGLERMLRKVTAVVCHDDRVAYSVIKVLEENGMRVPEDVSVVGYDNSIYSTLGVQITTVEHPKERYGRMAAEALLELIAVPECFDMERYVVDPELVIRKTVGTVKQNI